VSKKLNLLVQELISDYPAMAFLNEAGNTVSLLENALEFQTIVPSKPPVTPSTLSSTTTYPHGLLTHLNTPTPVKNYTEPGQISLLPSPITEEIKSLKKKPLKNLNLNKFYTTDDKEFVLQKDNSTQLFETLISQDFNLVKNNKLLVDTIITIVEKLFQYSTSNIQIKLLQFLNIDKEIFAQELLLGLNNLISSNYSKKQYTFHTARLRLTTLCFIFGDLCMKTFIKSYPDHDIRDIMLGSDKLLEDAHQIFVQSLGVHALLKDNEYLCDLLNFSPIKSASDSVCKKILQKNTNKVYKDNVAQAFYALLKAHIYSSEKSNRELLSFGFFKEENLKLKIQLGSILMHAFKKHKIFKEQYVRKKNRQALFFVPNYIFFGTNISSMVSQRPYFAYDTLESIIEKYENKKIDYDSIEYYKYNTCLNRKNNRVHYNPTMMLKPTNINIHKKKLISSFTGKHYFDNFETYTSFIATVDKNYLYDFLNLLKEHLIIGQKNKDYSFFDNVDRHSNIFLLYKIKPDYLKKSYKEMHPHYKRLLEHIFDYACNFSIQNSKELLLELKNNTKPNLSYENTSAEWRFYYKNIKTFKSIIDKIYSYKIFLRGLLIQCIIYSHVDFFIIDSFLDTRGRHYLNGFYTNPQSYPLVKAFIKPYTYNTDTLTPVQFMTLKDLTLQKATFFESIEVATLFKKELGTYNNYLTINEDLKMSYIFKLFENPALNIAQLKCTLETFKSNSISSEHLFKETLAYVKIHMTNLKRLYVLHSTILLYLNPVPKITNYFELDATASGLQMTSMVLRDANLAEFCNLSTKTSNSTNHDIYMIFSKQACETFDTFFKELLQLKIPKDILKIIRPCFTTLFFKKTNFKEPSIAILINIFKILKQWLLRHNTIKFNYNLMSLASKYNWIFKHVIRKSETIFESLYLKAFLKRKTSTYKIFTNITYLLGSFMHLKSTIKKSNSWFFSWLSQREVFKKAIMTFGYNATPYRRKEDFLQSLIEHNDNKITKNIIYLAQLMENMFQYLKDNYLKSSQVLRDFGKILAENLERNPHANPAIYINNGIFDMKLECYKQRTARIRVKGSPNNKDWHLLNVKVPLYVETNQYKTSNEVLVPNCTALTRKFAPNFIHSMDAWLVCNFKFKIAYLNEIFNNELFINHITNHDTFAITIAPLLKYILMDIYKNIYFFDYITSLENNPGYNAILTLWYNEILNNKNINKLNWRLEGKLGSPVTITGLIVLPDKPKDLITLELGASTNLILHPNFVK
jgi:hypothetical protein